MGKIKEKLKKMEIRKKRKNEKKINEKTNKKN